MSTFPAVLVIGARQTGKTTLLRMEFGNSHQYLSLERPDVRARALTGPPARGGLACRGEKPQMLRPGIRGIPCNLAW